MTSQIKADSQTVNDASSSLINSVLEYSNAWSVSREFYILKYIRVQRQGRFKTQNQNKTARYQNHKLLVFFFIISARNIFVIWSAKFSDF